MRIRLRRGVLAGTVALVFSWVTVQACGPDFKPDVFVRIAQPDDQRLFAEGKLGILQTGYDSNEFAVAYRYLNGGTLSTEERAAYAPSPEPVKDWTKLSSEQIEAAQQAEKTASPVGAWLKTRKEALAVAGAVDGGAAGLPDPDAYYSPEQVNCPNAAFKTAVLTLNRRAETWGRKSAWLTEWIHAQDAVFTNCDGKRAEFPSAAPAGAPALLHADRAYQAAAANFYARKYDEARAGFEAISEDADSPWRPWGGYLAARSMVRKAFAMGKTTNEYSLDLADFDMDAMRQAQKILEKLLADTPDGLPREAVEGELKFVRIRTELDERAVEICAALAGPGPDAHLKQDLDDLNFILLKNLKLTNTPPLLEWIDAVRHGKEDEALAQWQKTQAKPWLVAAFMKADPKAPEAPALIAAAAKIEAGDPAYATVLFHRVRILTEIHRTDEARALADSALQANRATASSDRNAFLSQRLQLARSFDEFLEYAPRTVLDPESSGYFATGGDCESFPNPKDRPKNCVENLHAPQFDDDAVAVLNKHTPLTKLVEAAQSTKLPQNLRNELAMAAWTRSVVLGDAVSAAKLVSLLPEKLRNSTGTSIGFPATLALLQNPGLRPVVEQGYSRFNSYDTLDSFRDNWWCGGWQTPPERENVRTEERQPLPYLLAEEQAEAAAEYSRVMDLPCAPTYLGRRVIEYAKAHPGDPDVPEALALTVRATRYACLTWGKSSDQTAGEENSATSKAAFQLLHMRYPKSPWTVKTKYYY
jgi:hypothetical protein